MRDIYMCVWVYYYIMLLQKSYPSTKYRCIKNEILRRVIINNNKIT